MVAVSGWSITLRASRPRTTAAAMNIDRAPNNRTYLMASIAGLLVRDQIDSVKSVNGGEELVGFRGALGVELDDIAGRDAFEEPLDIGVAQADAAVRLRVADGRGLIGAVDAVAFLVQADPPAADRVPRPRLDYGPAVVIRRVGDAVDDGEGAGGARRY